MYETLFFGANNTIVSLVSLAVYALCAFSYYKLAKIRGLMYPWLAFLPFANLYMIGMIGDSLKYYNPKLNRYIGAVPLFLVLPILSIAASFLGGFFLLGMVSPILRLALIVAELLVYYLIFEFYDNKNKILFTILSVIPLAGPICILYVTRRYKI